MKICTEYYPSKEYRFYSKIDEIKIIYENDSKLIDKIKIFYNKTVLLIIPFIEEEKKEKEFLENNFQFLQTLFNTFDNIKIVLDASNRHIVELAMKNNFPHFFSNLASSWEELNLFSLYGISDVYIGGNLGFDLVTVSQFCKKRNILIRACPNEIFSQLDGTISFCNFFIRPEDIDLYSKYIDVYDFFESKETIEIILKAYFKDQQWFGYLPEIIKGLYEKVDNRFILKGFASKRINCKKRCIKGGSCNWCLETINTANTLKTMGIFQKKDKI